MLCRGGDVEHSCQQFTMNAIMTSVPETVRAIAEVVASAQVHIFYRVPHATFIDITTIKIGWLFFTAPRVLWVAGDTVTYWDLHPFRLAISYQP